ncbi:MAG: DUF4212 domain-containing protein [Myxococcota bacterium]
MRRGYWRANLRLLGILLSVWFAVSFGAGILFAEPLNQFKLPGTGFPLGFWFAQQGGIYVFVALIVSYAVRMNHLDKQFGVDEDDDDDEGAAS